VSNILKYHFVVTEDIFHEDLNYIISNSNNAIIQQTQLWTSVISPISPDKPFFIISKYNNVPVSAISLYLFQGEFGNILTSIPHAGPMGGIFSIDGIDSKILEESYRKITELSIQLAKDLKCISLTIITNPFKNDAELYKQSVSPTYIFYNFCQYIDLKFIENKVRNGILNLNENFVRNVKKCWKNNIHFEIASQNEIAEWYLIHKKRCEELRAQPLPKQLIDNIYSYLNKNDNGEIIAIKYQGKVIGGMINIWQKHIADYFIMSNDSNYMSLGISQGVFNFSILRLLKKGIEIFNLQSCQKNSGVYTFKERMGGIELPFEILTWTFGAFPNIFKISIQDIAKEYQYHYIAPFEALSSKLMSGTFFK
jgi:hypothetical protein